ncbi:Bestrophin-2 [Nymphon striatum]|nr:Bestrophin-2 [Nymphon striatum]
MTINYQHSVANASFFTFTKLLIKWRGSIYKLLFKELLLYTIAYSIISTSYRHWMTHQQKRSFEKVVLYCERTLDLIPLSFVLGFYVTFVVTRWWNQFMTIPWPDSLSQCAETGSPEVRQRVALGWQAFGRLNNVWSSKLPLCLKRKMMKEAEFSEEQLMRYVNLSFVMVSQSISIAVKKRFPTLNHLVEAGFLTDEEKIMIEEVNLNSNKHWIPTMWFVRILDKARIEGKLSEGAPIKHIVQQYQYVNHLFKQELNDFRSKTGTMWCYDWVTVPLVYTQVVTIATHVFFVACLIGRQYLDPDQQYSQHDIDLYVPFFTFLQFCFYMGWLKVAEQLINPYGEDDDDFEINWLIDRHIQVSYTGVDELYTKVPTIEKDVFWNNEVELPYTEETLVHKIPSYQGSTMHMIVEEKENQSTFYDGRDDNVKKNRANSVISSVRSFLQPPILKITKDIQQVKRGRFWSVDHTLDMETLQVPASWAQRKEIKSESDQNIEDSKNCKSSRQDHNNCSPVRMAKRKFGMSNNSELSESVESNDFICPLNVGSSQRLRIGARNSRQESKVLLSKLPENDLENSNNDIQ